MSRVCVMVKEVVVLVVRAAGQTPPSLTDAEGRQQLLR
jgi:hypothetical protein